jgi:S1-C subfamily serine protease
MYQVMKFGYIFISILTLVFGFFIGKNATNLWNSDKETGATTEEMELTSPMTDYVVGETNMDATEDGESGTVNRIFEYESALIDLFEKAAPSVCFITTSTLGKDFWNRNVFEIPAGSGSGFIWDRDGHIVTNFHVIRNAKKIRVTLADQNTYDASLVGVEPSKDLAVIKIDAPEKDLKPIQKGRSAYLRVGQFVMAIGNPFGLDQTLTTGVISALGREITSINGRPIRDVIQTDAAINPGNSGGPLLDSRGKLIGVNTQIYSTSGASAGIGFSIPVDEVMWAVPDLIRFGEVRRPLLGVSLLQEREAKRLNISGAMITQTAEGGPAQKAGLRGIRQLDNGTFVSGDIITRVNNIQIENPNDVFLALEKLIPGDVVELMVDREGKDMKFEVKLVSSVE